MSITTDLISQTWVRCEAATPPGSVLQRFLACAPLRVDVQGNVLMANVGVCLKTEELRRKDHIIAALTERIPELEAPESASEAGDGSDTHEAEWRPWWRRWFGFQQRAGGKP